MRGLSSILSFFRNEFKKFNNTGARKLDSIYHMSLKLVHYRIYGAKTQHIAKYTRRCCDHYIK